MLILCYVIRLNHILRRNFKTYARAQLEDSLSIEKKLNGPTGSGILLMDALLCRVGISANGTC